MLYSDGVCLGPNGKQALVCLHQGECKSLPGDSIKCDAVLYSATATALLLSQGCLELLAHFRRCGPFLLSGFSYMYHHLWTFYSFQLSWNLCDGKRLTGHQLLLVCFLFVLSP